MEVATGLEPGPPHFSSRLIWDIHHRRKWRMEVPNHGNARVDDRPGVEARRPVPVRPLGSAMKIKYLIESGPSVPHFSNFSPSAISSFQHVISLVVRAEVDESSDGLTS
jgi:hypothetical protein